MAFKMKGFNPGQGTGMGSAFLKKQATEAGAANRVARKEARVESREKVKTPNPDYAKSKGSGETGKKVPSRVKASEDSAKSPLTKPGDRAEKLRSQVEKIKGKKKEILYKEDGSLRTDALSKREAKKHQRLSEKQMRKTAKANRKEQIQKNIDAGAKTRKEKRANTQKFRQGNLGNTTQTMVKSFDNEGEKRKTTTTERGDGTVKTLDKNKKTGVKTMTDTRSPEKNYVKQKPNRGTGADKNKSTVKKGTRGDAFKAAREAGKAKFTYEGKEYHTRRADESKADWQSKFNTSNPSPGPEPAKKK